MNRGAYPNAHLSPEELMVTSADAMPTLLDVIAIGRCSVDLYGQQIGSRLA
jgi:hypothetical protein